MVVRQWQVEFLVPAVLSFRFVCPDEYLDAVFVEHVKYSAGGGRVADINWLLTACVGCGKVGCVLL